jgi:hypothetical protein
MGLDLGGDWSALDLWLCSPYLKTACLTSLKESFLLEQRPWRVAWVGNSIPVDYCLSDGVIELDDKCGLHFSVWIMVVVCLMNLVKCLCICYTFLLFSKQATSLDTSLVTIGDAIASFLGKRDSSTLEMCLASVDEFKQNKWNTNPRRWRGKITTRMFSLATRRQWLIATGS